MVTGDYWRGGIFAKKSRDLGMMLALLVPKSKKTLRANENKFAE